MPIRLSPGQVVTGGDFFDRDALLGRVSERLPKQSVELVAPRRFGKTSIMRRLVAEPPGGCLVHFLDCEDITHPSAFVDSIAGLLLDQRMGPRARRTLRGLGRRISAVGRRIEKVGVGFDGVNLDLSAPDSPTWSDAIDDLLAGVRRSGRPAVVITDEFSMMLENFMRSQLDRAIIVNL